MKNVTKKLKNKNVKTQIKTNRTKKENMANPTPTPAKEVINNIADTTQTPIEQPTPEINIGSGENISEPVVEEVIDETKPCMSCAEKALQKKINSNYFIASASILALMGTTVLYRRGNSRPTLIGISFGVFALLLLNSLIQGLKLQSFKNKLKS